ncbi:MAG: AIR synthase-related protein, partial [Pseudorhodoplanes sp.]
GGFPDNIPRALPQALGAHIDLDAVKVLPVFQWLAKTGGIAMREMLRTFNCGIGMIAVVSPGDVDAVLKVLRDHDESVAPIGKVVPAASGEERVTYSGALAL